MPRNPGLDTANQYRTCLIYCIGSTDQSLIIYWSFSLSYISNNYMMAWLWHSGNKRLGLCVLDWTGLDMHTFSTASLDLCVLDGNINFGRKSGISESRVRVWRFQNATWHWLVQLFACFLFIPENNMTPWVSRNSCTRWVPGCDVTTEGLSLQTIAGCRTGPTNHNIYQVGPVLHKLEDPSCTQAGFDQSTVSICGCVYNFLGPNGCRNFC